MGMFFGEVMPHPPSRIDFTALEGESPNSKQTPLKSSAHFLPLFLRNFRPRIPTCHPVFCRCENVSFSMDPPPHSNSDHQADWLTD